MSNNKCDEHIKHHLTIPTGRLRLFTIYNGLGMEIKLPGFRLTGKTPKCSTILRKEFGLSGKPEKLLMLFKNALVQNGVIDIKAPTGSEMAAES